MSTRLPQPIYLLLIISLLAVSGNAVAEEQHSDSADLYPRYANIDPVEDGSSWFSTTKLMDLGVSSESFSVVPTRVNKPAIDPADSRSIAPADERLDTEDLQDQENNSVSDQASPGSGFGLDALLVLTKEIESVATKRNDEKQDSILFFSNIEKIINVGPSEEDVEITFAVSDPIMAFPEGDCEADESVDLVDADLTGAESAVSLMPLPVPDIPLYTNKRINAFIRMYTKKKRAIFEQAIDRSGKYMVMINRIFREYEMPPNLAYLAVVESNFNPFARSRANAVGMWQFMKYTGRIFNLNNSWWHDDRFDPEMSTVAAAKYLKRLHRRFNGDWELALAAYNSGSGTVRKAIRRAKRQGKKTDFWSLRLPRETRGYVPAFYAVATIFRDLESYGFTRKPIMLEEVSKQPLKVAGGISLKQIAKALDIDRKVLSEMNPSLRLRGLVPPTFANYQINVPGEMVLSDQHFVKLDKLAEDRLSTWKTHTVKQGDTLWSISRYYRIPVKKILAFNRFRRKNLINIGQKLMLPVATNWVAPKYPSRTKLAKKALDKLPGITHVHKVQKGDTLWKISNKYNIPIRIIKHWNRKVLNRRVLRIGTEIVLKLPTSYPASST